MHCSGLLPGISLYVHAQIAGMDLEQKDVFVNQGWDKIKSQLESWVDISDNFPCMNAPIAGTVITFALDRQLTLGKGVMQIEAAPDWAGMKGEAAFQISIPAPAPTNTPKSHKPWFKLCY